MKPELSRFTQFENWCSECAKLLGMDAESCLESVSGDASFRSYYRLSDSSSSYITVNSPPAKEKNHEFVALAKLMFSGGVKAPEVLFFDEANGFLLLEDFGDDLLLPRLTLQSTDLYNNTMTQLIKIQALPLSSSDYVLPIYDSQLLTNEMNLFREWFVTQMLAYQLSNAEDNMVSKLFESLVSSAKEQASVFVHRDFHARNLMLLPGGAIGVIDFQDAVAGPVTYDLVSLYKDCYIRWPRSKVVEWVEQYRLRAINELKLPLAETAEFLKQFDLMGLQRHIKVLGIFARLYLRDGKSAYLNDLTRVLAYVRETCGQYEEFAEFDAWFEKALQPLIAVQQWYKPGELDLCAQ